jgi:CelD/BcsL family acetyltransferase involved in cellulose biosynthesis
MASGAATSRLTVRVLEDFEDPALDSARWDRLLADGPTNVACLTLDWQREWWRAFGCDRDHLMLVIAEEAGEPRAIAPLYADGDILYLGSDESDAVDFIGHVDEHTLTEILAAARRRLPEFLGIQLYHVPAESSTTALLPGVAIGLGLDLRCMYIIGAPYLDLTDVERVIQVVERRKLRKQARSMSRESPVQIRLAGSEDLDPWLDRFFAQHVARWTDRGDVKFNDERRRDFCWALVHAGHHAGWLRFTMLEWKGIPAAFDITLVRGDRHLAFLVSRDPSITHHSPGKHLEAHVIRAALESGARRYEFGIGDQTYKRSRASATPRLVTWAMWPK